MNSILPRGLPVLTKVNTSRVATMGFLEKKCEAVFTLGYDYKVNVIWHESVGPGLTLGIHLCDSYKFKICLIVFNFGQSSLPPITSLGDVVWITGND